MKFIRSGVIVTGTSVTNAVISFVGVVILARIVPPGQLGVFFVFQASLGLLSIPAAAGLNGAIEKRISQGEHGAETLTTALVVKVGILTLVSGALLLFQDIINSYIGGPYTVLLIAGLLLQEGSRAGSRTIRGEKRVATAALLQSMRTILWIGLAIIAALLGKGTQGLIYSLLIGYFATAVSSAILQRTGIGGISMARVRSLFSYAKHNAVTTVGGSVYVWLDTAILRLFVGPSLIAAYEIAWRISKIGLIVSRSVSITTFPQISEWAEQDNFDVISNTISDSFVPAFLIVIPAFFGALLFAPDILYTIYGPEYVVAAGVFVVLTIERIVRATDQILSRCLHAIDRPDLSARATIASIFLNLVLNWIFIQEFGILGAAFATSMSFGVKFAIEYIYLEKLVHIEFPVRDVFSILLAAVVMTVVLLLLDPIVQMGRTQSLFVLITVGAIFYFGFLLIFQPMRQRAMVVFNQLAPNQ